MNVLLIVDPQNDFITGTLPVPGATAAMDYITAWTREHHAEYDAIIITSIPQTTAVSKYRGDSGPSTASASPSGLRSTLL